MRAVLCKELGGPDKLVVEDLPSPPIRDGAVRLKVHAAGVNFADVLMVSGQYQARPQLPFTPGLEASGVIAEIGKGVTSVAVGDRVMAMNEGGAFAEEAVLSADRVYRIPDTMDLVSAAGFPVVYGTSYGALNWRTYLEPGEWLLVLGAAGGVGLTAVEIGKAMGLRVIAAASTAQKLELARQYGADELIDYSREDLRERVKAITGSHGADVIYDPVGGDAFDASLRCVAWGGHIIIIGFASGRIPQIPANLVLVKNIDIIGFYWGSHQANKPALIREGYHQLFGWFKEGKLKPHISERFDLKDAAKALNLLKDRKATGKVVLTTGR